MIGGKVLIFSHLPPILLIISYLLRYSSTAACAAARRAMGTRNGEQLT